MPDNVDITPGAGATVATDEVGGRHYQRVKLTDGAEGSENHASVRPDGTQEVSVSDLAAALYTILEALTRPISQEPGTGRIRVAGVRWCDDDRRHHCLDRHLDDAVAGRQRVGRALQAPGSQSLE
jgi:hypothetical protein